MKNKTLWFCLFILVILLGWILLSPGLAYFNFQVPFTTLTPAQLTLFGIHIPRTDLVNFMIIAFQVITIPLSFFAILSMDKKLGGEDTDIRIFIYAGLILLIFGVWVCAVISPVETSNSIAGLETRASLKAIITRHALNLTFLVVIFLVVIKFPKKL